MKGKGIVGFILGAAFVGGVVAYMKEKEIKKQRDNRVKYLTLFREMNQYVVTKQLNKEIKNYFIDKGYKSIAIYGMSHIGQRLIDDLEDTEIEVLYGIDRRAERMTYELDIYNPEDDLPEVDAIIVTSYDFTEIRELLEEKVDCDIISFDEIIFAL